MPTTLIDFFFNPPHHRELLFILLGDSKCQINAANSSGLAPLKAAVMQSDASTVSFLIENGAIVDTELMQFARKHYPHKPMILAVLCKASMKATIDAIAGNVSPSGPSRRRRQAI